MGAGAAALRPVVQSHGPLASHLPEESESVASVPASAPSSEDMARRWSCSLRGSTALDEAAHTGHGGGDREDENVTSLEGGSNGL